MMSEPGLPLNAMSGSMVLPLPGSVLRSKTHAITKSHGPGLLPEALLMFEHSAELATPRLVLGWMGTGEMPRGDLR